MNVTIYTDFGAVPPALRNAIAYPRQHEIFLSLDWFETLYREVLADGCCPRIYIVSDADRPVLAFYASSRQGGRVLYGLSTYYTIDYAPATAAQDSPPERAMSALLGYIDRERPAWHSIELRYLRIDRPENRLLAQQLRTLGYCVNSFPQYENWFLPVEQQSFDDYYAARPSVLRNTVKRKEARLRQAGEVQMKFFEHDNAELDKAIVDYATVYKNSWKQGESFEQFVAALIRVAARLGVLRLGLLYLDGVPAAAQLWLIGAGRAIIYKLAYDERFKQHSPGSLLSRELFRMAIDQDRVAEIDYGIGSEAYKRDWMSDCRQVEGLQAFNLRTAAGLARAVLHLLRRAAKRLLALIHSARPGIMRAVSVKRQ